MPPYDPTVGTCLGPYGIPKGGAVSDERGYPSNVFSWDMLRSKTCWERLRVEHPLHQTGGSRQGAFDAGRFRPRPLISVQCNASDWRVLSANTFKKAFLERSGVGSANIVMSEVPPYTYIYIYFCLMRDVFS